MEELKTVATALNMAVKAGVFNMEETVVVNNAFNKLIGLLPKEILEKLEAESLAKQQEVKFEPVPTGEVKNQD